MDALLTFHAIIAPLLPLIEQERQRSLHDGKYTLSLLPFSAGVLFCIIQGVPSISRLVTLTKSMANATALGLVNVSQSMYSESFARLDPDIFKRLLFGLLDQLALKNIPEVNTLGRLILVDGSVFPAIQTMIWAKYKEGQNAVKLHLAYDLNRMIPLQLFTSAANQSERAVLLQMLEAGVTYIADRGYASIALFKQIADAQAFFVIRIKATVKYTASEALAVDIPLQWRAYLSQVTDELIVFNSDKSKQIYRLVSFEANGEHYRICTNRLDLLTHQVIMLYAYRWQIELFFRCIKRCFGALHLLSHNERGIATQFYLCMIAYVLLLHFKQEIQEVTDEEILPEECDLDERKEEHAEEYVDGNIEKHEAESRPRLGDPARQGPNSSPNVNPSDQEKISPRTPARGIVTILGGKLQCLWKIGVHWLTALRERLRLPFDQETVNVLNSVT